MQDVYGSVQDVKNARDQLKLGDTVAVEGSYENEHSLLATRIVVLQSWRDTSPNTAFIPQPSALHSRSGKPTAQAKPNSAGHQGSQQQLLGQQHVAEQGQHQQAGPDHTASPTFGTATVEQANAGNDCTSRTVPTHAAGTGHSSTPTAAVAAAVQQGGLPAATAVQSQLHLRNPQLAVCKFWLNSGRCAKGAACPYMHLQASALRPTKAKWLTDRCGVVHANRAAEQDAQREAVVGVS